MTKPQQRNRALRAFEESINALSLEEWHARRKRITDMSLADIRRGPHRELTDEERLHGLKVALWRATGSKP